MSATIPLSPYLISGMNELTYKLLCVLAEKGLCLQTDVVEAHIGRATAVKGIVLFGAGPVIVSVAVEVIVDGVVIDHLGNRHIEEEIGILCPAQILREELHKERLAYAFVSADKQRLGEFVSLVGKHLLGKGAVVEVIKQEDDYLLVVVIYHKLAPLRGKNNTLCDTAKKVPVEFEDVGVGQVGE